MDDNDDPFASVVIPICQPTSSQEVILKASGFAGKSKAAVTDAPQPESLLNDSMEEEEAEEEEEPVTQIIIESLPDSQNDEFQTPPEQANSTHFSSDDQANSGEKIRGEQIMVVDDGSVDVSLDEVTSNLGLDGIKEHVHIGASRGECSSRLNITESIEVCNDESGKLVDVDDDIVKMGDKNQPIEDALKVFDKMTVRDVGLSKNVTSESPLRKLEVKTGKACNDESVKAMDVNDEMGKMCEKTQPIEHTRKVVDKMPVRELGDTACVGVSQNVTSESPLRNLEASNSAKMGKNGDGRLATKRIEDLDKFKYVSSGGSGRRKLPFPSKVQDKNVTWESSPVKAKKPNLEAILDRLKLVLPQQEVGDGAGDADFLGTAKKRGLTFPRPRWWPPEGSAS